MSNLDNLFYVCGLAKLILDILVVKSTIHSKHFNVLNSLVDKSEWPQDWKNVRMEDIEVLLYFLWCTSSRIVLKKKKTTTWRCLIKINYIFYRFRKNPQIQGFTLWPLFCTEKVTGTDWLRSPVWLMSLWQKCNSNRENRNPTFRWKIHLSVEGKKKQDRY
jgi:hypothetical protein